MRREGKSLTLIVDAKPEREDLNRRNMKNLFFNGTSELNSLNDVIHDEYFCLNDVKQDKNTLEVPFRRIFHYYNPPQIIKRGLLSKIGEIDVLRCALTINNVEKYEVVDRSRIGTYSFNAVEYDDKSRMLKFHTSEDCDLNVAVSGISIEYREIEYRGKARIRYWLFGESNDSKVYE